MAAGLSLQDVTHCVIVVLIENQMVLLLRDPVERDHSHFLMHLRNAHKNTRLFRQGLPEGCASNSSTCMEQVIVREMLTASPWHICFRKSGIQDVASTLSTPEASFLQKDLFAAEMEQWIRCVEEDSVLATPSSLSPIIIPSYTNAVSNILETFERVLILRSEVHLFSLLLCDHCCG